MTHPILTQAANWESISSVCLQHLSHLPIFLFIVIVAAFVFLPFLLYGSAYAIYRINQSLTFKARQEFGCPTCGESVKIEWDFCPKCGGEIYLPAYPATLNEVIIEDRPYNTELPVHMPNLLQLPNIDRVVTVRNKN